MKTYNYTERIFKALNPIISKYIKWTILKH